MDTDIGKGSFLHCTCSSASSIYASDHKTWWLTLKYQNFPSGRNINVTYR